MVFDFNRMPEALGAWFVAFQDKDWLGVVFKETVIGPWLLRYRVRLYDHADPDPWSGLDRKVWDEFRLPAATPRPALLGFVREFLARVRAQAPRAVVGTDEVLVDGDGAALAQALLTRPWMHGKADDEARAWQRAYQAGELSGQRWRGRRPR